MIFNKELDQIRETDLQELIDNNVEESLVLDYKGELTSNKEMPKTSSSMANAKGGVLIYGIGEDQHRRATRLLGIEPKGAKEKVERRVIDHTAQT
jgi:predicted HTH transcriptional regulator